VKHEAGTHAYKVCHSTWVDGERVRHCKMRYR